jgi:hypothetical protein
LGFILVPRRLCRRRRDGQELLSMAVSFLCPEEEDGSFALDPLKNLENN